MASCMHVDRSEIPTVFPESGIGALRYKRCCGQMRKYLGAQLPSGSRRTRRGFWRELRIELSFGNDREVPAPGFAAARIRGRFWTCWRKV